MLEETTPITQREFGSICSEMNEKLSIVINPLSLYMPLPSRGSSTLLRKSFGCSLPSFKGLKGPNRVGWLSQHIPYHPGHHLFK